MVRLTAADTAALSGVPVPQYAREGAVPGIVHFGVGNFHRAHEAMYIDRVLNADPSASWGICGVGVLTFDERMRDVLREQDGLYTLVTKRPDGGSEARVIGSIVEYLYAPEDRDAVIERLAAPSTRIVSLTITEGGYSVDDTTGEFDPTSPAIAADLASDGPPQTAFGLITEALRRRHSRGVPAFTIMSCDNIQGNGHVAKTALTAFAKLKDPVLGQWVEDSVAFPNSMVDRITPVTTSAGIEEVAREYGIEDAWPVLSEAYEQWVLEDDFPFGRPDFAAVGVQLVPKVLPYELMKLRLLNASHQAMSYLGILAGYSMVHEVVRTELFADFLRGYMTAEAMPTLDPVPGVDLLAYREELIARFSSEAIADTLARQVVDGSDRMAKFIVPVLTAQLRSDGPIEHIALVIAAWSRYLEGTDEAGNVIIPTDRRAASVVAAAEEESHTPGAFLSLAEVFGQLGGNERLQEAFLRARGRLRELGAEGAIAEVNDRTASATG